MFDTVEEDTKSYAKPRASRLLSSAHLLILTWTVALKDSQLARKRGQKLSVAVHALRHPHKIG